MLFGIGELLDVPLIMFGFGHGAFVLAMRRAGPLINEKSRRIAPAARLLTTVAN
jgi:hypothetical protein